MSVVYSFWFQCPVPFELLWGTLHSCFSNTSFPRHQIKLFAFTVSDSALFGITWCQMESEVGHKSPVPQCCQGYNMPQVSCFVSVPPLTLHHVTPFCYHPISLVRVPKIYLGCCLWLRKKNLLARYLVQVPLIVVGIWNFTKGKLLKIFILYYVYECFLSVCI